MAELDKGTPSRRVAAPGLRAMLLGGTVVAALVGAGALPAAVGPALAQGTQPATPAWATSGSRKATPTSPPR
jgi:hypothetical protein